MKEVVGRDLHPMLPVLLAHLLSRRHHRNFDIQYVCSRLFVLIAHGNHKIEREVRYYLCSYTSINLQNFSSKLNHLGNLNFISLEISNNTREKFCGLMGFVIMLGKLAFCFYLYDFSLTAKSISRKNLQFIETAKFFSCNFCRLQ